MEQTIACLRAARRALGKTQEDVAVECPFKIRMLVKLESGAYSRVPYEIMRLQQYYRSKGIEFLPEDENLGSGIRWKPELEPDPSKRDLLPIARALLGLSQGQLAKLSNLSQAAVSRAEAKPPSDLKGRFPGDNIAAIVEAIENVGVIMLRSSGRTGATVRFETRRIKPREIATLVESIAEG